MYTLFLSINIVHLLLHANKYMTSKEINSTTAAYNLQANSLDERWFHVLKDTLKATANKHQDWVDQLPIFLLGLRAQPSSDRSLSPHQMVFGTEPYLPADFIGSNPTSAKRILSLLLLFLSTAELQTAWPPYPSSFSSCLDLRARSCMFGPTPNRYTH